jgi:voltage-gated sodium channel
MAMTAAAGAMGANQQQTKEQEEAEAATKKKKSEIFQAVIDEDDEKLEELCMVPKKEKPKYNDPEKWEGNGLALAWIKITDPFYHIAYGRFADLFDAFIITVIIIAGTMVGLQTDRKFACPSLWRQENKPEAWKLECPGKCVQWEEYCAREGDNIFGGDGLIDQCVKWIFVTEMVVKILAQGTHSYRYWCGHQDWRWNNFDFCIVMLSFEEVASVVLGGSFPVAVLRLFRLARLLKLVGKVPKLQSIVIGLIAGIKAVGYIALLLFLVFYIFAIAGMIFFMPNDPFHFRSIPIAILSLFRAATLEDWTDIMYINIYGCDKYASGVYYVKSSYKDELTGEPIPGAFDGNPYFSSWEEVPNYFRCNDFAEGPRSIIEGGGGLQAPSPAVSVSFWILFTFVSAFVMLSLFVGAVTLAMSESMDGGNDEEDFSDFAVKLKNGRNTLKQKNAEEPFATKLKHCWNKYAANAGDRKHFTNLKSVSSKSRYRFGVYSRFAEMCKKTAEHPLFAGGVTFTICVAGVTVGIEQNRDPQEGQPAINAPDTTDMVLWYMDVVINWIFTVEVLMKLFGEDWHVWTYFYSNWNKFDFVIVFFSWLPLLLAGELPFPIKLLRLLRLFRVLRVIKFLPALALIVEALLVGMESIGFIAIILFMVFYLFAILGMMIFEKNDPYHFGTLPRALLSLFRVSTFEDWTDVMYTNIYSCSQWGYSDDDTMPRSGTCSKEFDIPRVEGAIYFVIFVFLGALVLLTLFVGVITTSMEVAQQEQEHRDKNLKKVKEMESENKIPWEVLDTISQVFEDVDIDSSGQISLNELKVAMKFTNLIEAKDAVDVIVNQIMKKMDLDDDAEISLYEFTVYIMNHLAMQAGSSKRFDRKKEEDEK